MRAGTGLKFENCESVQHRVQFFGIRKAAKISFHSHFKAFLNVSVTTGSINNLLVISLKHLKDQNAILVTHFWVSANFMKRLTPTSSAMKE